jgi:hypothetical protein
MKEVGEDGKRPREREVQRANKFRLFFHARRAPVGYYCFIPRNVIWVSRLGNKSCSLCLHVSKWLWELHRPSDFLSLALNLFVKNKNAELGWISENWDAERSTMYVRLVKKHFCDVRDIHSAPNTLIYSFRRQATVAHGNSYTIPESTVVNTLYV